MVLMFDNEIKPNSNHGNLAFHLVGMIIMYVVLVETNIGCSVPTLLDSVFFTLIILQRNNYHDQLSNVPATLEITILFCTLMDTFNAYLALIAIKLGIILVIPSVVQREWAVLMALAEFTCKVYYTDGTAEFDCFGKNRQNNSNNNKQNNIGSHNNDMKHDSSTKDKKIGNFSRTTAFFSESIKIHTTSECDTGVKVVDRDMNAENGRDLIENSNPNKSYSPASNGNSHQDLLDYNELMECIQSCEKRIEMVKVKFQKMIMKEKIKSLYLMSYLNTKAIKIIVKTLQLNASKLIMVQQRKFLL